MNVHGEGTLSAESVINFLVTLKVSQKCLKINVWMNRIETNHNDISSRCLTKSLLITVH